MKIRRIFVPLAVAAIAALAVTGCTTPAAKPLASGGTITVAEVNELTSFNSSTPAGNLDINAKILGYTRSAFYYLDDKLNIVPDKSFGTIKKLSDKPLKVEYTLAKNLKWSDGSAISADDMLLAWAIQSGHFNDSTSDADGKVTTGTTYFDYSGDTTGLGLTDFPKISADNLSMTLTYKDPFADWKLVNPMDAPIKVVATKAGTTVKELVKAFKDTPRGDATKPATPNATIKAAADFWNTGFDATSLPTDKSLFLSSGPMLVSAWTPKQSVTMVKNPKYTGDLTSKVDKIIVRFIGDSQAQVTALKNGEVDIINPQSSADTIATLKTQTNVTTLTGDQFSYDHLDLSFNTPVFKDKGVREAFLKVVPRQQILDAIVTPQNPNAKIYDSQLFFPGTANYTTATKANGSSAFDKVDVAGAKTLLKGATPTVRVLYNTKNPNRVAAFQALQASAAQAGFKIEDGGSPKWGSLLGTATYDASIFGWISSGVGVAGVPQIFSTKGGGNYSGYSNSKVDELATKLQITLDTKEQDKIQQQIENLLWADYYGAPLFVAPGVMAYNKDTVKGVVYYPGQAGVGWNFWEWSKPAK